MPAAPRQDETADDTSTWLGRDYAPGALGETRLRAVLKGLCFVGVLALHDRRIQRSKQRIDHLVVTAAGVWVIDAQTCVGPLSFATRGTEGPRQPMEVQDHDDPVMLRELQDRVGHVTQALSAAGVGEVPVRGALCFVDAQPVEGQRPIEARGLLVTWTEQLQPALLEAGPYDEDDRAALLRLLSRTFEPLDPKTS